LKKVLSHWSSYEENVKNLEKTGLLSNDEGELGMEDGMEDGMKTMIWNVLANNEKMLQLM